MSSNPTATLARPKPKVDFCLAVSKKNPELICTRIDNHRGHCCDEISRKAWTDRGEPHECTKGYNHSKEKGLVDA